MKNYEILNNILTFCGEKKLTLNMNFKSIENKLVIEKGERVITINLIETDDESLLNNLNEYLESMKLLF